MESPQGSSSAQDTVRVSTSGMPPTDSGAQVRVSKRASMAASFQGWARATCLAERSPVSIMTNVLATATPSAMRRAFSCSVCSALPGA